MGARTGAMGQEGCQGRCRGATKGARVGIGVLQRVPGCRMGARAGAVVLQRVPGCWDGCRGGGGGGVGAGWRRRGSQTWMSLWGFQSESKMTTVSAVARLMPRPPARVDSRKQNCCAPGAAPPASARGAGTPPAPHNLAPPTRHPHPPGGPPTAAPPNPEPPTPRTPPNPSALLPAPGHPDAPVTLRSPPRHLGVP